MRKLFLLSIVVLVIAAMLLVTGCEADEQAVTPDPVNDDQTNETPANDPGIAAGDGIRLHDPDDIYIYVGCMWNLEYFIAHKIGWEYAGDIFGVKTSIMGPAEYDIPAMISAFESAIAMEPAGIVTFAVDPELIPVINQAVNAGIPVVTVCGDQPGSERMAFVGTHQYDAGYFGGRNLAAILDEGEVALLTIVGVPMFAERDLGYLDAIEKYSDGKLEVVATGDTQADIPTGISVAKSILAANPDLKAFVCTDSVGAISAATAVKEAGLAGEVFIIGMDRNLDVLGEIEAGVITASVAQNDALMPFYGMSILYHYNYSHVPITLNNQAANISGAPEIIYTGAVWVDGDNYHHFMMD